MTALATLLLSQHARTLQGFCALVQRAWVCFGHKFADRCGHSNSDDEETSPIFIQFLDCVWQLLVQVCIFV